MFKELIFPPSLTKQEHQFSNTTALTKGLDIIYGTNLTNLYMSQNGIETHQEGTVYNT